MKNFVLITVVAVIGFIAVFYFLGRYNADIKEVKQKNLVEAQVQARDAVYDNTWKKIQQSLEIADIAQEKFKDVYVSYMEARAEAYGEGGALMKFVQESVPQGDVLKLFENVQRIMEASRDELTHEQKKLVDYDREHRNIIQTGWTSWFVGDRDTVTFNLITSTRTKQAASTGVDDDVSLRKPTAN